MLTRIMSVLSSIMGVIAASVVAVIIALCIGTVFQSTYREASAPKFALDCAFPAHIAAPFATRRAATGRFPSDTDGWRVVCRTDPGMQSKVITFHREDWLVNKSARSLKLIGDRTLSFETTDDGQAVVLTASSNSLRVATLKIIPFDPKTVVLPAKAQESFAKLSPIIELLKDYRDKHGVYPSDLSSVGVSGQYGYEELYTSSQPGFTLNFQSSVTSPPFDSLADISIVVLSMQGGDRMYLLFREF